jgi:hypothetical protein
MRFHWWRLIYDDTVLMFMQKRSGSYRDPEIEIHSSFKNVNPILTISLTIGFFVGLALVSNFIIKSIANTGAYCFIGFFIPYTIHFIAIFIVLGFMLKRRITADGYSIREEGPFYYRNIRWGDIEKIYIMRRKKVPDMDLCWFKEEDNQSRGPVQGRGQRKASGIPYRNVGPF